MTSAIRLAIADDDSLLAHSIGRLFEPPAFEIALGGSGDRVFDLLKGEKFHALLIGCPRPTREVLDRLEKIRQSLPDCAILVMTSGTRPRISRDFADSILIRIIEKPFMAAALRQALVDAFVLVKKEVPRFPSVGTAAALDTPQGDVAGTEAFDQLFANLVRRQPLDPALDAFDVVESHLIRRALIHCQANQSHTARFLGITRNTLRKRIAKYKFEDLLKDGPDTSDLT